MLGYKSSLLDQITYCYIVEKSKFVFANVIRKLLRNVHKIEKNSLVVIFPLLPVCVCMYFM